MASKLNYRAARARSRMALHGAECIHDYGLPGGLVPPRPRPSKASQRAEIEAVVEAVTKTVT